MPRLTNRKRLIDTLAKKHKRLMHWKTQFMHVLSEEESLFDDLIMLVQLRYLQVKSSRYVSRDDYRKPDLFEFHKRLHGDPDCPEDHGSQRFEDEFLNDYRLPCEAFWILHRAVRNHDVFKSPPTARRQQAPSEYQLLVLLRYLGLIGNGGSNRSLASHFSINRHWKRAAVQRSITSRCPFSHRIKLQVAKSEGA